MPPQTPLDHPLAKIKCSRKFGVFYSTPDPPPHLEQYYIIMLWGEGLVLSLNCLTQWILEKVHNKQTDKRKSDIINDRDALAVVGHEDQGSQGHSAF